MWLSGVVATNRFTFDSELGSPRGHACLIPYIANASGSPASSSWIA